MTDRHRRVVWSRQARDDLLELVTFVGADSPTNAAAMLGRIEEAAASLGEHAERGRVLPELQAVGLAAWREVLIKPFRLVYRVDGGVVLVGGVIDGRRDLGDVLLGRLLRE